MAQRVVDFSKLNEVMKLIPGDKVKLTDGSTAEFVRLKQKNFVGVIDGGSYNIPVNMFIEVVKRVDMQAKEDASRKLKKGDWFYINKSGKALLFQFERYEGSTLIGTNPIDKSKTRIASSLYVGKVE